MNKRSTNADKSVKDITYYLTTVHKVVSNFFTEAAGRKFINLETIIWTSTYTTWTYLLVKQALKDGGNERSGPSTVPSIDRG